MKQKILYKPNKLAKAAAADAAVESGMPSVASDTLLGEGGELKIRHNGDVYSLRKTRFGKLILTK